MPNMNGVNARAVLQRAHDRDPGADHGPDPQRRHARPTRRRRASVIGVWATASRRKSRVCDTDQGAYVGARSLGAGVPAGQPAVQRGHRADGREGPVERRPPTRTTPGTRSTSTSRSSPGCCRCSTRASFPNLAAYTKPRADLDAILLTGIPEGVVPGFQNYTGPGAGRHAAAERGDPAERRRRTTSAWWPATPPASPTGAGSTTTSSTIELRAVAGLTIPLVDPTYTPDGAASAVAGRDDEHQRGAARRRSPTSGCRVAATRPSPARRRRHERACGGREPVRRAGLGPARHRGRRGCPGGDHAGRDGGRRGRARPARPSEAHGRAPPARRGREPAGRRRGRCRAWCSPSSVEGQLRAVPEGHRDVVLVVDVRGGEVATAEWPS